MAVRWQAVRQGDTVVIEEIHKVVVHRFRVGADVDPNAYAAAPMYRWQQSEQGKFVIKYAIDTPKWERHADVALFEYQYAIIAELEAKKLSEFYLRWGEHGNN